MTIVGGRSYAAPLIPMVKKAAARKHLHLAIFNTSSRMGSFMGERVYALYKGKKYPFGRRSKDVVTYETAPFQRNYTPSAIGERRALTRILNWLE